MDLFCSLCNVWYFDLWYSLCFFTDEEIINQIKGTNKALAEIKELLKQQVKSQMKYIVCHQRHRQELISGQEHEDIC